MARVEAPLPTPLLEVADATVLQGGHRALDGLSLRIAQGQHTAILGRNGSGKSTLVKLLARQAYPLAGAQVRIFGRERWSVTELRSQLGIVSPAVQQDFATDTPVEVVDAVVSAFFAARGLWQNHAPTPEMHERALAALAELGVPHLAGRTLDTLSTGEARRVLIARALVHRPHALLLDEPCAGLDPATRHAFLDILRAVARGGTTLLLVTHHVEEILPEIGHVVMLRGGRLLAEGAKRELLRPGPLGDVFEAPVEVAQHDGWYRMHLR